MIETRETFGVTDTDNDPRLVGLGDSRGDYIYALNIRNSNSTGQQRGSIEPVAGFRPVTFNLPAGTNECIGSCSHPEESLLYYFVWNSAQQHTIYEYDYRLNSVRVILRSPVLNFLNTHHIVGARVMGRQLFFNDAFNEPRRVDIPETADFNEPPVIWSFVSTGPAATGLGDTLVLQGTTPPPFTVGQQIYIRRDWRRAWLDAQAVVLEPGGPPTFAYLAQQHKYDLNPQFSGVHVVTAVLGNTVSITAPGGVNEVFIDTTLPQPFVFVPGVAYLHDVARVFDAPFNERYIKLYRAAPHFPAFARYSTDITKKTNNLRRNLYQFRYRWVYRNGMKSHFSPISKIPFPEREKATYPWGDNFVSYDNCIDVWVDSGELDVIGIELAVKNTSNPADQDLKLVRYFDKADINSNTSFKYRFYGDEVLKPIDIPEAIQPMDEIPFRANDLCFLQDKRIAIGAIDEGFDHIEINSTAVAQVGTDEGRSFEVLNNEPAEDPNFVVAWFPRNRPGLPPNTGQTAVGEIVHLANIGLPPAPFGEDFTSFVDNNVWTSFRFDQSTIPLNPSITSDGTFVFFRVIMQISKGLVFSDLVGPGAFGFARNQTWPTTVQVVNGSLTYANPELSVSDYYFIDKTWEKVLEPNDTAETVRDWFIDQIMNVDPLTITVPVRLTRNLFGTITTAVFDVQIKLQAFDNDFGVGDTYFGTNIYLNPNVFFPLVPIPPLLSDLRGYYRAIGVVQMRTSAGSSSNQNLIGFKTGATHPIAIEYRDDVGRRATVSPSAMVYSPYFNEAGGQGQYNVDILLKIFNNAPEWATHYQIMYAGNASMTNWLQFEVRSMRPDTDGRVFRIELQNRILQYNEYNNGSIEDGLGRSNVSYSWTQGDRLRLRTIWLQVSADSEVTAPEFVDLEIIGQAQGPDDTGTVLLVELDALIPYLAGIEIQNEGDDFNFYSGSVIEVYSPKYAATEEELFYYEVGEVFKITNGQHWGNQLNQGPDTPGSNNGFAQVLLKNVGDAYVITRKRIPPGYGDDTSTPNLDFPQSKLRKLESPWYSDFYSSLGWGPGTPNRFDKEAKREFKGNIIRYSDLYIAGTKINGLNRFYGGNLTDEADSALGQIMRMLCPESSLVVFQELSTGILPVRATELTTATGRADIFRFDNVVGKINYYQGNFGIGYHREALVYHNGFFYHPSTVNGQYMRLGNNGYFPISAHKRVDYFHRMFDFINKSRQKVRILSAYDTKYDELVVHVPDVFNLIPPTFSNPGQVPFIKRVFEKVTMAFSEPKKGWVTEYAYHPETIGRHFNKLFSWKNGRMYIHDENESWNTFYAGEDPADSVITLVFNSQPVAVKFLQSMGMNITTEPKEVVITTPYGAGQETAMFSEDFIYRENEYWSVVYRDINTPDVDNPVLDGDVLRGEYFVVRITFERQRKFELFAVSLRQEKSEMTGR